jgi:multicomponent Na+:H+ antiporter subunit G
MNAQLLPWMADALVVLGLLIISIAIYGMTQVPNLFIRLHAASKATTVGVVLVLIAVSLTGDRAIIMKSLLAAIFLLLTMPVASHAIGYAIYREYERGETGEATNPYQVSYQAEEGRSKTSHETL